ncbi:uncharacterized protein LOC124286807 [Haliotis rubra]|uniref:uncharacterized protein LOC124286807 n=1 Tax=Haliotis rubra TaxID=36100 RepID=UPI001EE4F769|nr:uncharacterized protein LOC124286807 [Haliotis rubra]
MDKPASGDKGQDTPSYFDIFKGPPRHVARVTKALQAYMEKMEVMKDANAHLLTTMVDMCPKTWKILPELKIYLEDQSMLWSLVGSSLRPLFAALRNYEAFAQGAQQALLEFEVRLSEVKLMSAEYELMKRSSRVSKAQQFQIEYMLRESGRALVAIRKVVEDKMLTFRRSQTELGKELLLKFEDIMKVTCVEGGQVSDLIQDILRASPVKKTNRKGEQIDHLEFVLNHVQKVVDKVGSTPVDLSSKRAIYFPEKAKPEAAGQLKSQGRARTEAAQPRQTHAQLQSQPQTEVITRPEASEQDRPASTIQYFRDKNEPRRMSLDNYTEFNRTARPYHSTFAQEEVKVTRVTRPKTATSHANSSTLNSYEYGTRQGYRYDDERGVREATYKTTRARTRYVTPSNGRETSGRQSRSSSVDADDTAGYMDSNGVMSPRPPSSSRQNYNGVRDQMVVTRTAEQTRGTKRSSGQDRQTQTPVQTRSGQRKSGLPFKVTVPDSHDNVFFECS